MPSPSKQSLSARLSTPFRTPVCEHERSNGQQVTAHTRAHRHAKPSSTTSPNRRRSHGRPMTPPELNLFNPSVLKSPERARLKDLTSLPVEHQGNIQQETYGSPEKLYEKAEKVYKRFILNTDRSRLTERSMDRPNSFTRSLLLPARPDYSMDNLSSTNKSVRSPRNQTPGVGGSVARFNKGPLGLPFVPNNTGRRPDKTLKSPAPTAASFSSQSSSDFLSDMTRVHTALDQHAVSKKRAGSTRPVSPIAPTSRSEGPRDNP